MTDDDLDHAGFVPIGEIADPIVLRVFNKVKPPSVVVFQGRPAVFWLAICVECNNGSRPIPMPFGTQADRDRWVVGHRTTGHTVHEALEIRP